MCSGTAGGAGRELLLPWQLDGALPAAPGASALSPALPEAGRKEGAAGRTLATKGCQALQSYPDLCVRAWKLTFSLLLGLGFAAGLSGWGEWSWPGCMQSLGMNPCIIFK